jgi:hypothetical protein
MSQETMRRGRSQVLWKFMPESVFRYNGSGGWCKTTEITLKNTKPLEGALAEALRTTLKVWDAIDPTGFPDPLIQAGKYTVGEPHQVWFTVFPLVFTCRNCGRVQYYSDSTRVLSVNPNLTCKSCKGVQLRQVPFAYVHECGRMESVFIPGGHPGHNIKLINKGTFQESYWFCETCNSPLRRNDRDGLGFRSCACGPKKAKRGITLDDSRIYYPQTLSLVDIEPQVLARWKDNSRFSDILLAAALQIPAYKPEHLLDLTKWKANTGELSPELKATKDILLKSGMSEGQANAVVRQAAELGGADPWMAYDNVLAPLKTDACARDWRTSRRTIEYVFVRDEPSSAAVSLDQLIAEAHGLGDQTGGQRLTEQKELAAQLGLVNLRIVQSLPILLAAIGYSRVRPAPQPSEETDEESKAKNPIALRPFAEQSNKLPIYVAENTTEAFFYELDPWRMAAFLSCNLGLTPPDDALGTKPALLAWLINQCAPLLEKGEAHLVLAEFEKNNGEAVHLPSALVFGVVHTLSHVLKATAHRYVGIDGDSLAEYLFPGHFAGLLYVSTHVEFTLGGIDSVFPSNLTQWLGSARDYAGRCSFDPVCSDSHGGACLACLYPKFGCMHFNRTLSRAFLFGGQVLGRPESIVGFWSPQVVQESEKLLAKSSGNKTAV